MLTDAGLLARLIALDSTSSRSNRDIADFLSDYLEVAGCRIWRQSFDDGAKTNLLASRGADESRGGLMLSAHMDVVPATEPDWKSNPFTLTETDGRFVGRGTADMKGWLALAVTRIAQWVRTDTAPLHLLITADEEVGCLGARHFARNPPPFPLPRSVLVGEPTELQAIRLHKGHLKAMVRVHGKPAHSGYPHLGENAIERAGVVLVALTEVARRWTQRRAATSEHFPECPFPVLNLGTIVGGSAVNVVPAACEIQFGVRLLPGQESDSYMAEVREALEKLPEPIRSASSLEVLNDNPPMLCDADAPLHRRVCELLGQTETIGVAYASDAGWLSTLGCDCVLHGPGSIRDAHKANESIDIDQWRRGAALLDQVIAETCAR